MKKYLLAIIFFLSPFLCLVQAQNKEERMTKRQPIIFATMIEEYGAEKDENGYLQGFLIDFLNELSNRVNFQFEIKVAKNSNELLLGVVDGKFDGVISFATINSEREKKLVNFSFPFLFAGSSILINKETESILYKIFQIIFDIEIWVTLFGFMLMTLTWGLLSNWVFNKIKRKKYFENSIISLHFAPLFFKALWFTTVKNALEHLSPKSSLKSNIASRLIIMPIWIIGLIMTSVIIAQISSKMTINSLGNNIKNIQEIKHFSVGTIRNTVNYEYLKSKEFQRIILYDTLENLYVSLKEKKVKGIFYDHPSLLALQRKSIVEGVPFSFLAKNLQETFVGIPFNKDFIEKNKKLFNEINYAIMDMHNDGSLKKMRIKWYGN